MSKAYEVTLPKLGESIHEATIVAWLKQPGDYVHLDEPLLEVSTDKVNSEIPSPCEGVLKEICAQVDEKVDVGAILARVGEGAEGSSSASQQASNKQEKAAPLAPKASSERSQFFSPAVLRIAKMKGIPLSDLEKITGTGAGGRVSKRDLEKYLATKQQEPQAPSSSAVNAECFAGYRHDQEEELVPMSAMRKAIAENMVKSFYEAPHASLVTEVDVTGVNALVRKERADFLAAHGAKLTITSCVIQAIGEAVKQFPLMNCTVQPKNQLLVKHYVNVGIAVSIEQGLVVPVLRGCHRQPLVDIAKGVADLSSRARTGRLQPKDVEGGTITLTNFGMSGTLIGTPILRHPEVAILGMGAIQKRVAVLDDNSFGIREMMYLSLTFDHRVIDGMYGCAFLNQVKANIESFSRKHIYPGE